jgi:hypothetical protein
VYRFGLALRNPLRYKLRTMHVAIGMLVTIVVFALLHTVIDAGGSRSRFG